MVEMNDDDAPGTADSLERLQRIVETEQSLAGGRVRAARDAPVAVSSAPQAAGQPIPPLAAGGPPPDSAAAQAAVREAAERALAEFAAEEGIDLDHED